jgi:Pvc16 N-terminal domain
VLGCFLRHDALPDDVLSGVLADQPLAVIATIGLPPSEDRNLSDIWSALGGELKPSLDLVVSAPFETGRAEKAAPLVVEEPRITVVSPASSERAGGKKKRRQDAVEREPRELPDETVVGGTERRPGRIVRIREIPRP